MLTLFTVPKPFAGKIDAIQHNALGSWKQLGEAVEVLLIGDEPGTAQAAREYHFQHIPQIERTRAGTPRVDSAFELARQHASHAVLGYLNADIILLGGTLQCLTQIRERFGSYLVIGQRWDLAVEARLDFGAGWEHELWMSIRQNGQLHQAAGSDYFLFPSQLFTDIPPFALGRSGWDNWMIYSGRRQRIPVVDATGTITVVHQEHDYSHLEGGVPHYRLPESRENVRMAGGRQTVFTLRDATWRFEGDRLVRVALPGGSLRRAVETALTTNVGTGRGLKLLRAVLYPREFFRSRLRRRLTEAQPVDEAGGS